MEYTSLTLMMWRLRRARSGGNETGGRLHSSEYGCRYMLELGKPRSNYQAQAGDEET